MTKIDQKQKQQKKKLYPQKLESQTQRVERPVEKAWKEGVIHLTPVSCHISSQAVYLIF